MKNRKNYIFLVFLFFILIGIISSLKKNPSVYIGIFIILSIIFIFFKVFPKIKKKRNAGKIVKYRKISFLEKLFNGQKKTIERNPKYKNKTVTRNHSLKVIKGGKK